jgi:hypothetical protein
LYFGLKPSSQGEEGKDRRWELALAVYFVMLLSSSPSERYGVFGSFWQMSFLHKPNHVFALALIPWWIRAWTDGRRMHRILGGGLILTAIAWIFLVHWSYIVAGLFVYVIWALWEGNRSEAGHTVLATGISFVGAIPYIAFLLLNYGWQQGDASMRQLWYKPGYETGYYDVFAVTLEHGVLFFLSVAGIVVMAVRRRQEDRIWLSLLVGTIPIWVLQLILLFMKKGGEPDELYFFIRFLLAFAAGIGAFFVLKSAGHFFELGRNGTTRLICLLLLLTLPLSFPFWWNPLQMDRYYPIGLEPIPKDVMALTRWVRGNTSPDDVFLAGSETAVWIAALSGRRALLSRQRPARHYRERLVLERRLLTRPDPEAFREACDRFGLTHLALDESYLGLFGMSLSDFERLSRLEPVHEVGEVRVYRVQH